MRLDAVASIAWIAAIVVIAGAAGVGLMRSHRQSQEALEERFTTRTTLSAGVAQTYATQLMDAEQRAATLGLTRGVTNFDTVVSTFGFSNAVLLDGGGRVLAVRPPNPSLIGQEIASRYAHLTAAVAGRRAISPVVPAASNAAPVIAFAVPFDTPGGRRVFSGAFQVDQTPLPAYLQSLVNLPTSRYYLIDGGGQILASSVTKAAGRALSAVEPRLAEAYGPELSADYGSQFFAARRVMGSPWVVVAAVDRTVLLEPVGGTGQYIPWAILGLLFVSAVLVWWLLGRRRADNRRLSAALTQLDRVARQDGLTGAQTRRSTTEQLEKAASTAQREGSWLSVLMLDVDHFKRINDTFGHAAGDEALIAVAEQLQSGMRSNDVFGRWGGEEFVMVLPDTDPAAAECTAERLRAAVEGMPVSLGAGGDVIDVTVSVGVASGTGNPPEVLIHAADRAMYAAKAAGRNRVRTTNLQR